MIETIVIEGFIYGIMVLGLFISYRTLNFCDMTVDGAFPMGGCILAACLCAGLPPYVGIFLAFIGGCIAGLCTTLLYTRLRVPDLLAGILMMTMLYSINLRIMSNRANISFLRIETTFSRLTDFFENSFPSLPSETGIFVFLLIFIIIFKFLLAMFFHTDLGLTMGALGVNQQMIVSQGVNPQIVRGIGVCFGDGLAALSGAFAAMYNGFADVGSGTGIIVSGLASLMLGEFIIRSNKIGFQTLRVLLGSIIYRALMLVARRYGHYIHLTANDLKLITGFLIIASLIVANFKGKSNFARHLKRPAKDGSVENLCEKSVSGGAK